VGAWALGAVLLALAGCAFGPLTIYTNRLRYNESVRQTWNEEFLLNLVRLRYRDPPQWDAITNILASHSFDGAINASEDLHHPSDYRALTSSSLFNTLHMGGNGGISEKPTITYSPLEGPEFTRHLLEPIHLETLQLLGSTSWDVDRILRVTVQEMNHLENAAHLASYPEPAPQYEAFTEVARKLRILQQRGMLEFTYETFAKPASEPWPIEKMNPSDLLNAAEKKYTYQHEGEKGVEDKEGKKIPENKVTLCQYEKVPVARLAPAAWSQCNEAAEVTQLLNLVPGQPHYKLVAGAEVGQLKAPREPGTEVIITTRSVLGAMIFASRGVEIPQKHIEQGLAGMAMDENCQPFDWTRIMGDLIQVHYQRTHPLHAFVAIKYRGFWFYIDENDLNSKTTFSLIIEVYGLELAGGVIPGPLVTVPVGNGLQLTPGAGGAGGGSKGGGGKGG